MLKYVLILVLTLGPFTLFSTSQALPYFIDFGRQEFATHFYGEKFFPELVPSNPFNSAPEISTFFTYLKETYHIQTAIETGTFKGSTTAFLSSIFDIVHTVDINTNFYAESKRTLQLFPNIHCHLGSSPEILQQILPTVKNQRIIFYLDAHWGANSPLLNELTEIEKTHKDNCIIVIDDFKVPGRNDIIHDAYDGQDCALEYVIGNINKIFTNYTVHYLIPKNIESRAKFVAIPTQWVSE